MNFSDPNNHIAYNIFLLRSRDGKDFHFNSYLKHFDINANKEAQSLEY